MPEYRKAEVKQARGLWPLYGLLMMIAAGGIAWVLAPEVYTMLNRNRNFSIGTFSPSEVKLLITAVLFFVIVSIGGLIIAMFMPKRKDDVQDAFLRKQKAEMTKEEKARKIRRSMIERELKKTNKRLD